MTPRMIFSDGDTAVGAWSNVQFVLFSGQLQMQHIAPLSHARDELLKQYPQGIYTFLDILPSARLPAPDARGAAVEAMKRYDATQLASAFVIEGDTVAVGALRSVVSAMVLAARSNTVRKVFTDPGSAVSWLAAQAQGRSDMTLHELGKAMLRLRQDHMARAQVAVAAAL